MVQGSDLRIKTICLTATLWLVALCHVRAAAPEGPLAPVDTGDFTSIDDDWLDEDVSGTDQFRTIQNASAWVNVEYLLWWMQPGHTPPLVTIGPASNPLAGALGQPGTEVLFGGNLDSLRNGARFSAGGWLDEDHTVGLEATYFFLLGSNQSFSANSSDDSQAPVLARPFFNVASSQQDREIVLGSVQSSSGSSFMGAALNLLCFPCCECCTCPCGTVATGYTLGWMGGVSYFRLNESLEMTENLNFNLTDPVTGDVTQYSDRLNDRFSTSNNFFGVQIGPRGEWYYGKWFVGGSSQLALGVNHQVVNIQGSTAFYSPTPGGPYPGGFLALPTNIGSYSRDVFAVVPMLNLNVGRQVTNHLRLYIGYNFMYFSNVARPGDQIDPVLNLTQLPSPSGPNPLVGPARPAFQFHDTGMWLQGVSFGAQFLF